MAGYCLKEMQMNSKYYKYYMMLIALLAAYAETHGAEVMPGDYEQAPGGLTLGAIYYQHATTDALYSNGSTAAKDMKVESNIGIARMIHVFELSDRVTIEPQFLLPFGRVEGKDNASGLGSTSGIGDLVLTAPVRYRLNDAKDVLAGTLYINAPTGDYNNDKPLNLGSNRWKLDLQGAYVKHFTPNWALDLVGDVVFYTNNDNYGANSDTLKQDISFETQVMGRYMPNATTSLGLGIGHNWGGETKINNVSQDDSTQTTNIRFAISKFMTPKDQFVVQLGRDLSVENGLKEDFRLNLRYLRIF